MITTSESKTTGIALLNIMGGLLNVIVIIGITWRVMPSVDHAVKVTDDTYVKTMYLSEMMDKNYGELQFVSNKLSGIGEEIARMGLSKEALDRYVKIHQETHDLIKQLLKKLNQK